MEGKTTICTPLKIKLGHCAMKWKQLCRGNLKSETELLLIGPQKNAIRTIDVKATIEKIQEKRNHRLCRERVRERERDNC